MVCDSTNGLSIKTRIYSHFYVAFALTFMSRYLSLLCRVRSHFYVATPLIFRLPNTLYHIINKQGGQTIFKFNRSQKELYDNMWYCNVILKARQLGISTFVCLLFLDRCLFNSNVSAGILAHTLEDGQQMFRRVKLAYDCLPE